MEFFTLFEFVILSVLFAFAAYFMSYILRYKSDNKNLDTTYECGMCPVEDSKIQFQPKFIVYAMLFLLFEAECILIFPYALASRQLGLLGIYEVILFILILILSLLYAIKSGILRLK